MNYVESEYLSLAKAIEVTGVSEPTLARFAQAGYIKTKHDPLGKLELNRDELFTLFKIKSTSRSYPRPIPEIRPITESKETISNSGWVAPNSEETVPAAIEVKVEKIPPAQITANETETPASEEASVSTYQQENICLREELIKLKAVNELHEKYMDYKEGEIRSLTEERNWLRARLEKLEEKTERDQLILVSITETHRKLVHQMDKPKSGILSALQRIGLLPQPETAAHESSNSIQPGLRRDD